jgi:HlyD family secretion protein
VNLRRFVSLLLGAVVILGAGAAGLVYTYGRAHTLDALTATVETDVSTVGTPFAGHIQTLEVAAGDRVAAGQEIARVQSPSLGQSLETGFPEEGLGYRVDGDDVIVLTATADGVVGTAEHAVGSFVTANTEIATIEVQGTTRVRAEVPMTATDFARLPAGSPMTARLPDSTEVSTEVYDVQFEESEDGGSVAVVRGRSPELATAGSFTNGSPVTAQVQLDDAEGFGSWAARQLAELVTPSGATI